MVFFNSNFKFLIFGDVLFLRIKINPPLLPTRPLGNEFREALRPATQSVVATGIPKQELGNEGAE
jgi:hypothetical protein